VENIESRPETIEIRLETIDKRYGGLYALRRVSLEIASGECVVFAGRNGSGKTTLLRVVAQLVKPSAGKLTFPLAQNGSAPARKNTGFVAHATMVYDELTAEENLLLFARLLGIADAAKRVGLLLREVGLSERRDSLVRTFSRGMRQRVAIARALLHEPSVLLLDGGDAAALAGCGVDDSDEFAWRIGNFGAGYAGRSARCRSGGGGYASWGWFAVDTYVCRVVFVVRRILGWHSIAVKRRRHGSTAKAAARPPHSINR
jgi:ABC-type lipoprotein export system ATPase subunit